MSRDTYWAIRKREIASKGEVVEPAPKRRRKAKSSGKAKQTRTAQAARVEETPAVQEQAAEEEVTE